MVQRLDLDGLGLTELPSDIGDATGLKVLTAYRNRLTSLPDSMQRRTR